MDHIEETNGLIFDKLNFVLQTPFFRFYRINLNKPCRFWRVDHKCGERDCEVSLDARVPAEITQFDEDEPLTDTGAGEEDGYPSSAMVDQLGDISFDSFDRGLDVMFRQTCKFREDDFCVVDRLTDLGQDGTYH